MPLDMFLFSLLMVILLAFFLTGIALIYKLDKVAYSIDKTSEAINALRERVERLEEKIL